jgi:hypothetical protein
VLPETEVRPKSSWARQCSEGLVILGLPVRPRQHH